MNGEMKFKYYLFRIISVQSVVKFRIFIFLQLKCQNRNFSEDFAQKMFFLVLFFSKKKNARLARHKKFVFKQVYKLKLQ